MDLLDSEDSDGTSGDEVAQEPRGENGSDGVPGLTQQERAVRVPRLSGDCIGDDATIVHQKATRYIALQSCDGASFLLMSIWASSGYLR